jgi:hypothetical protein
MLGAGGRPESFLLVYAFFRRFLKDSKAKASQPHLTDKKNHVPFLSHTTAQAARQFIRQLVNSIVFYSKRGIC